MREPTREYCGDRPHRTTADSVWPLRGADGLTFAERKNRQLEAAEGPTERTQTMVEMTQAEIERRREWLDGSNKHGCSQDSLDQAYERGLQLPPERFAELLEKLS